MKEKKKNKTKNEISISIIRMFGIGAMLGLMGMLVVGPASATVSMDNGLKNLIDTLAPDYYNNSWNISESQFKAWIAIITLSEAPTSNWGYAAQSTGAPGSDVFDHIDTAVTFKFSTGMGPFQLDNGGIGDEWTTMTTLNKTDPEISLRSTLKWHNVTFGSRWKGANAPTLSDFLTKSKWNGPKRWGTSGDLKTYWNLITDSNWDIVKDKSVDVAFHPPTINAPYDNYVKKVGNYHWNILDGCYDTWLIKGKGPGYSGEFYYTHNDTLEIWVYNNAEKNHGFIRKYIKTQLPQDSSGNTVTLGTTIAGFTSDKKIVDLSSSCIDLVFLIDTTGSMWDDIDQVKLSANEIVNTLDSKGYDYRVAIADYKDYPCCGYGESTDYVYKLDLPFTAKDSKQDIINTISSLSAFGGADWQESVYSALVSAMTDKCKDCINNADNYGWRKGVTKAIILMGDAPPHDPEPWSGGHTLNDVTYWSNNIDPVKVYSIVIGSDSTTYATLSEISEKTGGKVYTSPTASDVVDAIIEAIGDIGGSETYGVSVNITPALNETSPGSSVAYSANITNEGNINDTYNVSLDLNNFVGSYRAYPVAIQSSWVTFNNISVELEPAISEIRPLAINVPNNWAGMEDVIYSFSITAKSETDDTISNTSSAELKIKANKRSMAEYARLETIWLSDIVRSSSITDEIKKSLLDKLTNATLKLDQSILSISSGKYPQANNMLSASQNILGAFSNQVEAQYDKKIMQPDATMLKEKVNQILQDIEKAKNT